MSCAACWIAGSPSGYGIGTSSREIDGHAIKVGPPMTEEELDEKYGREEEEEEVVATDRPTQAA